MSYLGNSPGVASQRVESAFTATSAQTVFTPSSGYTLGYCDVYQNGVKLVNGDDYTAADGATVTLTTGAATGDSIVIVASFPRGLSDGYMKAEADAKYATLTDAASTANGVLYRNGSKVLTTGNGLIFDGTNLGLNSSSPASLGSSIPTFELKGAITTRTGGLRLRSSDDSVDGYFYADVNGFHVGSGSATKVSIAVGGTDRAVFDTAGNLSVVGTSNFGNNAVSTHSTRLSGYGLTDGTNRYGSYGQLLLHCTSSWTGSARRYLITNGYLGYNLAIIRSTDASTDPALGNNGTISSGTADLILDVSGNLTLPTGNLVMSSGKGIDFSASSNLGGVAGEVLDDYETGSFTPTIDSVGNIGGLTAQTHYYVKVGKLVTVHGTFTYTSAIVGAAYTVVRVPFNHNTASGTNICGVSNAYPYDNDRQSGIVIDNSSGDAYGTYIGVKISNSGGGNIYWSLTYQAA